MKDGAIYTKNVGSLLDLPANVYCMDLNCIAVECNDRTLDILGVNRTNDFVGMNYREMAEISGWTENQGKSFKHDDIQVIKSEKPIRRKKEPVVYDKWGNPRFYITNRYPLKGLNNKLIGIIGISIDITQQFVAFQELLRFVRANHYHKKCNKKKFKLSGTNVLFTTKEANIIHHILRGKTSEEIGNIFHRSPKTIDTHIDNIKSNLDCRTKSELIGKIWDIQTKNKEET